MYNIATGMISWKLLNVLKLWKYIKCTQHMKHFYCHKNSFRNKYIIEKSIALPRFLGLNLKLGLHAIIWLTFIIVYLFGYNNIVKVIGISCGKYNLRYVISI